MPRAQSPSESDDPLDFLDEIGLKSDAPDDNESDAPNGNDHPSGALMSVDTADSETPLDFGLLSNPSADALPANDVEPVDYYQLIVRLGHEIKHLQDTVPPGPICKYFGYDLEPFLEALRAKDAVDVKELYIEALSFPIVRALDLAISGLRNVRFCLISQSLIETVKLCPLLNFLKEAQTAVAASSAAFTVGTVRASTWDETDVKDLCEASRDPYRYKPQRASDRSSDSDGYLDEEPYDSRWSTKLHNIFRRAHLGAQWKQNLCGFYKILEGSEVSLGGETYFMYLHEKTKRLTRYPNQALKYAPPCYCSLTPFVPTSGVYEYTLSELPSNLKTRFWTKLDYVFRDGFQVLKSVWEDHSLGRRLSFTKKWLPPPLSVIRSWRKDFYLNAVRMLRGCAFDHWVCKLADWKDDFDACTTCEFEELENLPGYENCDKSSYQDYPSYCDLKVDIKSLILELK